MQGKKGQSIIAMGIAAFVLSGCMGENTMADIASQSPFKMLSQPKAADTGEQPKKAVLNAQDQESEMINALIARQSILNTNGSYATVADGVLAANSRTAEAELRSAKLRAEAASKNWLPTLGPSLSLNSLGSVVASLVVDQVIFDNGRKKAEREFAKADVEVAAVNLVHDTNERVYTALELYVKSLEAREKAQVSHAAMTRMHKFEWVMEQRVQGGVSDRSDLDVLRQKIAEMDNALASDKEAAAIHIAELNAMSATPLDGVSGLSSLKQVSGLPTPLSVLKAEAEMERDIAQAVVARAAYLPGVSAGGTVGSGGSNLGVNVGAENGFGFGTGANLKALEAEKDAAGRRLAQAREDANRDIAALEQKLASAKRQEAQSVTLLEQARSNLAVFEDQVQSGQRALTEAVGVYETKVRTEREALAHKYRVALIELEMAKTLGLLVDGGDV